MADLHNVMDNCCGCGGKWQAALAKVNWWGFEGYLSTVNCPSGTCDYSAIGAGPPARYLRKQVDITTSWANSNTRWIWDGFAWQVEAFGVGSLSGHNQFTWTLDRHIGDGPVTGCTQSVVKDGDLTIGCDSPFIVSGIIDGLDFDGQIIFDWENFGYYCGNYTPLSHGAHVYFPGGNAVDLTNFLIGAGSGFPNTEAVVTITPVTDTELQFTVTWHHEYSNLTPPASHADSGTCRTSIVDASLSFHITLSNPYTFEDVYNDAVTLLAYWPFKTQPFRSREDAILNCHSIPMLRYNDNAGLIDFEEGWCSHTNDPAYDGSVLGKPGDPQLPPDINCPWGALAAFVPGTAPGPDALNAGTLYLQKWAMRQGSYLPFGWQFGAAKTWNYLLQTWTIIGCTSTSSYTCNNETGAAGFVMVISPNDEIVDGFVNGHVWKFQEQGARFDQIGERLVGNLWQAVCRDSAPDKYPDCVAVEGDGPPVEPSCGCDCPTQFAFDCIRPFELDCPCAPVELCLEPDNWP